jgi:3-deoxy-D-manno-octulosonic-acid transferase
MLKRLLRAPHTRGLLCWLIQLYIRVVQRTSRWTTVGAEIPEALVASRKPMIVAFWHGRMLMLPVMWARRAPLYMLISGHRDGRIIAGAVAYFGIGSIEGSSSAGGSAALRTMLRHIRAGGSVGITPDGPDGPAMRASAGIVAAARLAQAPIVPMTYATSRCRILGSWDRFHLALPFSRGVFLWGASIAVPERLDGAGIEEWRALIEDRLIALSAEADRMVGNAPAGPGELSRAEWRARRRERTKAPLSPSFAVYRALSVALGPAIQFYLARRLERGKEDPERFAERKGIPSRPRARGPLVWVHAASVGEAVSMLSLIDRLLVERPKLSVLVTTGTVTSARLLASRLPADRAWHQYVPVDQPRNVRRFLDHWRPDLALWVESELWPNLLAEAAARGIPRLLINGRMSARSFARWRRVPGLIGPLMRGFALCLAQDAAQAERFAALGAANASTVGDLKAAAAPLPVDESAFRALAAQCAGRPLWLAASTHEGEEEIAAYTHRALKVAHQGLLTIIAPRHPARADSILAMLAARGLTVARRSKGEAIAPATDVYLADTLGELGLFYRLAGIAFVGGSIARKGGHNPLEAALLDCAILHGPDMSNCAAMARALASVGATLTVTDGPSLAAAVGRLFDDPVERAARAAAAAGLAAHNRDVLDAVMAAIAPWLDRLAPHEEAVVA